MLSCPCQRCGALWHDGHSLGTLQSELDVRLHWAGGAQQVPPVECGLLLPNGALRHGHGFQLGSQFHCMQGKRRISAHPFLLWRQSSRSASTRELAFDMHEQPAARRSRLSACLPVTGPASEAPLTCCSLRPAKQPEPRLPCSMPQCSRTCLAAVQQCWTWASY